MQGLIAQNYPILEDSSFTIPRLKTRSSDSFLAQATVTYANNRGHTDMLSQQTTVSTGDVYQRLCTRVTMHACDYLYSVVSRLCDTLVHGVEDASALRCVCAVFVLGSGWVR